MLGGRRLEAEEMEKNGTIPSFPVRLLGRGGRRRRGGSFAPSRSATGGSYRRRRAAASRSGFGHGAAASRVSLQREKKRGRRSSRSRRSSLCLQGGPGSEEEPGEATATALVAAVFPLSPQLTMELTVGTHCQCFNLFLFPFYFQ